MSRIPPQVLALVALAALVPVACDGSAAAVRSARGHVGRGDLERAEAALAGGSGSEVERLRNELARARDHRAEVEERVARILSRAGRATAGSARSELRAMLDREEDAGTRQLLEQALSDLTDRVAASSRARVVASSSPAEVRERLVVRLLADVRTALEARDWVRALELHAILAERRGVDAGELRELHTAIVTGGRMEISRLRASACSVESSEGPSVALEVLEAEAHRFPHEGELSHFHREIADLRDIATPLDSDPGGVALGPDDDPERLAAARRQSAERAGLERDLMQAEGAERDAALRAFELASGAGMAGAALRVRMDRSLKLLRAGHVIDQLSRVAEQRAALDAARGRALERIFDRETYFYPYDPPPESRTAEDYARAQRAVDQAVAEVRDIWQRARSVRLSADYREAVEQVRWGAGALDELGVAAELPLDVPAWLLLIPRDAAEYGLADFARSAAEAGALERDRRIRARNERLWEAAGDGVSGLGRDAIPERVERDQVRVTNDYRALLGRRALAWNPRLQIAARRHSGYMAATGELGHTETDPDRRTLNDRLGLVDYVGGGSENCHRGGRDPQDVHEDWVHSSGHHRNILMPRHRELASGVVGFFWTQNFGTDGSFMEDLGE